MKIALLADLHANREALTAVLDDAQAKGADQYAFLGDLVGYGGDPAWVVDTVMRHVSEGAVAVMGNHDLGVVQGPPSSMREEARAAVEWTRAQLSPEQLAFLSKLPYTVKQDDCLFVHANAVDPQGFEYIHGRLEAMRTLHATSCRYTFCGHVHDPMLFHLSGTGKAGDFLPTPGVAIPLLSNRQWLGIPGSCGQPRDGNPAACWALFDHTASTLTFHRVPYDTHGAAERIRAAGLPARLAERLTEGT